MVNVAAGACQGCPSSRLPWTVRDQPLACCMTRLGREAKSKACMAGVMGVPCYRAPTTRKW